LIIITNIISVNSNNIYIFIYIFVGIINNFKVWIYENFIKILIKLLNFKFQILFINWNNLLFHFCQYIYFNNNNIIKSVLFIKIILIL